MIKHLRLPLALLAALAMLLLWTGTASATDGDGTAPGEVIGGVTDTVVDEIPDLPEVVVPAETEVPAAAQEEDPPASSDDQTVPQARQVPLGEFSVDDDLTDCEDVAEGLGFPATVCAGLPEAPECIDVDQFPDAASQVRMFLEELDIPLCDEDEEPVKEPVGDNTGTGDGATAPSVYFVNCDAARAAGAAPIAQGQPGYRSELDRDNDGTACDADTDTAAAVVPISAAVLPTAARSGQLAYTGFELTPVLLTAATLLALGGGLLMGARRRS